MEISKRICSIILHLYDNTDSQLWDKSKSENLSIIDS